jgi:hypothetical protein
LSSPNDPIRTARRVRRAVDTVTVLGVVALGYWSMASLPNEQGVSGLSVAVPSPVEEKEPVDDFPIAVFDRTLWYVPPVPVAVTPPKPPELPRLELIAIARDGEGFRALIADAADGEIRTVAPGDGVGVARVLAVEERQVAFEAHGIQFRLTLEGVQR